jgi:hypothetical protein
MQYVLILHKVESYPAWKAIFDQAADWILKKWF